MNYDTADNRDRADEAPEPRNGHAERKRKAPALVKVYLRFPAAHVTRPDLAYAIGLARETKTQLVLVKARVVWEKMGGRLGIPVGDSIRYSKKTCRRVGSSVFSLSWRITRALPDELKHLDGEV